MEMSPFFITTSPGGYRFEIMFNIRICSSSYTLQSYQPHVINGDRYENDGRRKRDWTACYDDDNNNINNNNNNNYNNYNYNEQFPEYDCYENYDHEDNEYERDENETDTDYSSKSSLPVVVVGDATLTHSVHQQINNDSSHIDSPYSHSYSSQQQQQQQHLQENKKILPHCYQSGQSLLVVECSVDILQLYTTMLDRIRFINSLPIVPDMMMKEQQQNQQNQFSPLSNENKNMKRSSNNQIPHSISDPSFTTEFSTHRQSTQKQSTTQSLPSPTPSSSKYSQSGFL